MRVVATILGMAVAERLEASVNHIGLFAVIIFVIIIIMIVIMIRVRNTKTAMMRGFRQSSIQGMPGDCQAQSRQDESDHHRNSDDRAKSRSMTASLHGSNDNQSRQRMPAPMGLSYPLQGDSVNT